MNFKSLILLLVGALSLGGCQKYYLSVCQQWVDVRYLASTHVNTPDPRQENPPIGQMLSMDWRVPQELLAQKPRIELSLIFWDYTEEKKSYPIDKRMGWATYKLLNDDYDRTGGILTYKAEIVTEDGSVYREWKHQLWVNLIQVQTEEDE
ncbi:MAG: hypothetical protein K2P51_07430 [Rhabdochlamydiaceae bacterium]|nr:hypothetical protein [Rhabdochlamydiaceae bacterium]